MDFCGEIRTNIGHAIPLFNGIIYLNLKRQVVLELFHHNLETLLCILMNQ